MITYNLNHLDEEPVLDYCSKHNKGALIKKALASGHIAIQDGEDPVQKSMNFLFAHAGVSSAIIGTINPKHLADNIAKAELALK
jgi:aryl-alcohol dehydrogenase-like predicted oxidoreductase